MPVTGVPRRQGRTPRPVWRQRACHRRAPVHVAQRGHPRCGGSAAGRRRRPGRSGRPRSGESPRRSRRAAPFARLQILGSVEHLLDHGVYELRPSFETRRCGHSRFPLLLPGRLLASVDPAELYGRLTSRLTGLSARMRWWERASGAQPHRGCERHRRPVRRPVSGRKQRDRPRYAHRPQWPRSGCEVGRWLPRL
jgi:hypothetical protein